MMISRKRVFAGSKVDVAQLASTTKKRGDKHSSALTKIILLSCHTLFYLLNEADDVLGRAPKKPD